MADTAVSASGGVAVSAQSVQSTIDSFTKLDASGDKRSMNKLARRLGKEQPLLLRYAAKCKEEHGDVVGEAAVFYGTLVWAMFDLDRGKKLPRLTEDNLEQAEKVLTEAWAAVDGFDDKPVHERIAPQLCDSQPHLCDKLRELIEEDVREDAMTADCAAIIYKPTQVIVEAFDAAIDGRRPGEHQGPIVREAPKVGRNEPCPCGSGNKYKKCCGKN